MEAKPWKQSHGSKVVEAKSWKRRRAGRYWQSCDPQSCVNVFGCISRQRRRRRIFRPALRARAFRDDRIEAEQRQQVSGDLIPDNVPLQELAEQVVRGKVKLTPPQLRMLIELLPFHLPKLSAVGVGYMTNNTFAERLDRAIDRSERAKLIAGRAIEVTTNRKSRPHHC